MDKHITGQDQEQLDRSGLINFLADLISTHSVLVSVQSHRSCVIAQTNSQQSPHALDTSTETALSPQKQLVFFEWYEWGPLFSYQHLTCLKGPFLGGAAVVNCLGSLWEVQGSLYKKCTNFLVVSWSFFMFSL